LGEDRPLTPWWLEEAPQIEPEPALDGDLEVDVAVVGGGYTGLWAALALRELEPSARVAVLEGGLCGEGPSGRNGGFLHGYWSSLTRARRAFGDGGALAVAQAGSAIVPGVRDFVKRRGVDVWLREAPMLEVSAAPAQDEALSAAVASARELGVEEEAVPVGRDELAERCSSPRFRRGVLYRDAATVQPGRLVRALRAATLAEGVVLHERTPLVRLRRGSPNVVETPQGRVRAGKFHQNLRTLPVTIVGHRRIDSDAVFELEPGVLHHWAEKSVQLVCGLNFVHKKLLASGS